MLQGRVLVIGRSDGSGATGLEADQKVLAVHGCYAMTATTALTVPNTESLLELAQTSPEIVRKQINACIDNSRVSVFKIGSLGSVDVALVVSEALQKYKEALSVIDIEAAFSVAPASLQPGIITSVREKLLPSTTILTATITGAMQLLEDAGIATQLPTSKEEATNLAKAIHTLGPKCVLLTQETSQSKQADAKEDNSISFNILYGQGDTILLESQYQNENPVPGARYSLSSAIAANLANGLNIPQAVQAAFGFVDAGIKEAVHIKDELVAFNNFHSMYTLPFAPGHFIEYVLAHPDVKEPWKRHTHHEFVRRLGDGTLPLENFKYYLVQDYLFLIQYSRATALAAYKHRDLETIVRYAELVLHVNHEMGLHLEYCKEFGLSKEDIVKIPESQSCTAYSRFVLDIGNSEDSFALQVALSPCLIGYGEIGRRLYNDPKTVREGNPYWKWISNYAKDDYTESVRIGSALLDKQARQQSPSRIAELVQIFIQATDMETGFWDMGYHKL